MLKALRIPTEKLTARGLNSAKERVTSIKDELGYLPSLDKIKDALMAGFAEAFSIKLEKGRLTGEELSSYNEKVDYFKSKKWIYSVQEPPDKMQSVSSVYKKRRRAYQGKFKSRCAKAGCKTGADYRGTFYKSFKIYF